MRILAIETSCDETGVAIVEKTTNQDHVFITSTILASSLTLHAKTGGIIPEIAAREQVKGIIPCIDAVLQETQSTPDSLDAIAVTYGPGLIGSLLVGIETAKTLSYLWQKPLIPVNHLIGHIYANFLATKESLPDHVQFPALALIVSGGHTDLVLMKNHGSFILLGGTRDDAAGEAFDKIGRLLGMPYPAGPIIEQKAKQGNPKSFNFPRPMINSEDFDFSFSGLKTAALREIQKHTEDEKQDETFIANIASSVQEAIVAVLTKKTIDAAKKYHVASILLAGGVAANQRLRERLHKEVSNQKLPMNIIAPQKSLCTDNGAMIGAAALYNYHPIDLNKIIVDPELYFPS